MKFKGCKGSVCLLNWCTVPTVA